VDGPDVREIFEALVEQGRRAFRLEVDGRVVGRRVRDEAGRVTHEHGLKDGRKHGPERSWDDEGHLKWETCYADGLEHGTARQWDRGRLVGTYTMVHGTGVDLWRDADGRLSEERYYEAGTWHGFERWWRWDERTVWKESHFRHGREHGVFREWNDRGRLHRGFSCYFVAGERVNKRRYLRAAAADPSLPPFRAEDDDPRRPLPREHLEREASVATPPA
jgi:hypothetical protein